MASVSNNQHVPTNYSSGTGGVNNNVEVSNAPPDVGPAGGNNVERGNLSGTTAAGEMSFSDAASSMVSGSDWGALQDSVQAANLSVSITAIMVMLVEIMAQMKQEAREEAFTQAVASLEAGLLAATEMENAAEDARTAARTQAIAQIVQGAASVVSGAVQLGGAYKNQFAGSGPNEGGYAASAVGSRYAAGGTTAKGIGDMASGIAGLLAANATFDAAMHTAASQEARANQEYEQALGQNAQAFMQQLAESLRAFLSTMQSVEQAQHKVTEAIYNC